MIQILVYIVVLILVIFGLVKVFDKIATNKNRTLFSIIIWAVVVLFGYLIYQSIQQPIKFDKLKEKRFQAAVNKMIDIKAVQMAYKQKNGKFSDNMDSIVQFIENESFTIIERKDTSVIDVDKNRIYGVSVGADGTGGYFKDVVITKELGRVRIKDSLFKNSDRYKNLNKVVVDGIEATIDMKAGFIARQDMKIPVFEAKLNKAKLLTDQIPSMVAKESTVTSVDGINGEAIILGSMQEVNMAGNWPKKYGNNE